MWAGGASEPVSRARARAAAHIEDHLRVELGLVELLAQALADLGLQERMFLVSRGGAAEGAAHLPEIQSRTHRASSFVKSMIVAAIVSASLMNGAWLALTCR